MKTLNTKNAPSEALATARSLIKAINAGTSANSTLTAGIQGLLNALNDNGDEAKQRAAADTLIEAVEAAAASPIEATRKRQKEALTKACKVQSSVLGFDSFPKFTAINGTDSKKFQFTMYSAPAKTEKTAARVVFDKAVKAFIKKPNKAAKALLDTASKGLATEANELHLKALAEAKTEANQFILD